MDNLLSAALSNKSNDYVFYRIILKRYEIAAAVRMLNFSLSALGVHYDFTECSKGLELAFAKKAEITIQVYSNLNEKTVQYEFN